MIHFFGLVAIAAAARSLGKGLLRALPLVGIAARAGLNKVMTQRVGERAIEALRLRPSEAMACSREPPSQGR